MLGGQGQVKNNAWNILCDMNARTHDKTIINQFLTDNVFGILISLRIIRVCTVLQTKIAHCHILFLKVCQAKLIHFAFHLLEVTKTSTNEISCVFKLNFFMYHE